jgi:hypothetical protein
VVCDLLKHLASGQRVDRGCVQFALERAAFFFGQQHARAALADALEDHDGVAEEADVEDGELELDVAEVTGAIGQTLAVKGAKRSTGEKMNRMENWWTKLTGKSCKRILYH